MKNLHIIFGGASVEHDVSIVTALQTYNALKDKYPEIPADYAEYLTEAFYNNTFETDEDILL